MSLFNMFKSKPAPQGPRPSAAIEELRRVEEMLIKKQEYLETKVAAELDIMKKNGMRNKRVSMQALQRKKRIELQLAQIDGTLSTIAVQRETLENSTVNSEVFNAMGHASKAMKGAHKGMNIDDVEDVLEDVREQQELADELNQAVGRPMGYGQQMDDDELLAELEEMEQQELDEQLLSTETRAPSLPAVPSHSFADSVPTPTQSSKPASKSKDDELLAELESWGN